MKYKVSVIIPVYNAQDYIERCVDHLMRQTLKEIEYIFVEDCSTDDSFPALLAALSKYPEKRDDVKLIRHEVNMGVAATRNEGNAAATGEFIIHCDSDDWPELDMYEKMYEKSIQEDADICICDFTFICGNARNVAHPELDCSASHEKIVYDYIMWTWNTLWNLMISKDLYDRSGAYIPAGLSFTEDFYLSVLLFQNARKITTVDEPLYTYDMTNASSIIHTMGEKSVQQELDSYERTIGWMNEKGVYKLYYKPMQWRILKAVCALVLNNRFDEFRKIHPESHRYIISAPSSLFSFKVKVMLTLAVLRLDFICRWDNRRHGRL